MFGSTENYTKARENMLEYQIKRRGITDERLLESMWHVPRHEFVLPQDRDLAYKDYPLPIGQGQTISQPYIVAYMIEQLDLKPTDHILEVGTGSGYSSAVMSGLAHKIYTVEVIPELYDRARKILSRLQYKNVICLLRDGYQGVPEEAPFDKIILTAAPEEVPGTLLDQLKIGGFLVAPVGQIKMLQKIQRIEKRGPRDYHAKDLIGVSFVEMVRNA